MAIKAIDGLPIQDAKHGMTLHITARDCEGGDPKRPDTCAAARAIRREYKVADVRVHLGRVYVRQNKGNWQRFNTPRALRSEIIAFDRGGNFQPGEYTLNPMPPSQRAKTGKRQGGKTKWRGTKQPLTKKRRPPHIVKDVRTGPA